MRDLLCQADKCVPIADALEVASYHFRVLVVGYRLEQVDLVHVRLVANADELAKADLTRISHIQDRREQRSRLR